MLKEMLAFVRAEDEVSEQRKLERMKKKLANLEVERCQRKMAHKDLGDVDQKINRTRMEFAQECEKSHAYDSDQAKMAKLREIKQSCQAYVSESK